MDYLEIDKIYKQMLPDDIIMSYKGIPSEGLLDSFLAIAETRLSIAEREPKVKKKVYHILIEALQNIYHHNMRSFPTNVEGIHSIIFILSRIDNGYEIVTGNFIPNQQIDSLKDLLDTVNILDADQLKHHYREKLNKGDVSHKGGAGLGFIDIARRSGEKLAYSFKDCLNGNSFFSLKIKIPA